MSRCEHHDGCEADALLGDIYCAFHSELTERDDKPSVPLVEVDGQMRWDGFYQTKSKLALRPGPKSPTPEVIADQGLIELLYALGEAAINQPDPTPALVVATGEYLKRKEVIYRANHPQFEADVAETCAAQVIGRRGGRVGGPARAAALSPERRSEIARQAARARWEKMRQLASDPREGAPR